MERGNKVASSPGVSGTHELVCRQRGNTGGWEVARAERQFRQHKSYLCVYHKNILLIYSLEHCPNKVSRGREREDTTVLVLSEKQAWPENVRTNTAYFITLPCCSNWLYKRRV